jgi:hypothetical protein
MQNLKRAIKRNLMNMPGWRTKKKIVVIESDDWGAIRLPSKDVLKDLERLGVDLGEDHYIRNDALASETDLQRLFDTLLSLTDSRGEPAKITANAIMANPDFGRIREGNFEKYRYEPFTETLKSYPEHAGSFELWKEGLKKGVFIPQFHGREHLHVQRWIKGLADRNSETAKVFDHKLYALCSTASAENRKSYMAAYEWDNDNDREFTLEAVEEGLKMFEDFFGFRSRSAIAPNYTWNSEMEKILWDSGVYYLQGSTVQRSPEMKQNGNRVIRHYTGQMNDLGQIYMVRNCRFEPTADLKKDWVGNCLNEINTAFRWQKPAIIESHRVNYIGYINPENRDRNLKLFEELLKKIMQRWPDVEFMSSDELGGVIEDSKQA